jgi:hypothetical protein
MWPRMPSKGNAMTVTLHWWYLPLALFLVHVVYANFRREPSNWWDMQLDTIFLATMCWAAAVGLLIGRFI